MKEMLLNTFNIPVLVYTGWFTLTLTEMESLLKVATGLVVFLYTCWRWYTEYMKE